MNDMRDNDIRDFNPFLKREKYNILKGHAGSIQEELQMELVEKQRSWNKDTIFYIPERCRGIGDQLQLTRLPEYFLKSLTPNLN